MSDPFIVSVSGKTIEEVKIKLIALAAEFGLAVASPQMDLPLEELVEAKTDEKPIPTKKPGRPAKKVVEDKGPDEVEEKDETPPAKLKDKPPAVGTRTDATEALKAVNSKLGLNSAREVLQKFGAGRFSELKEDQYGEFVAECKKALG